MYAKKNVQISKTFIWYAFDIKYYREWINCENQNRTKKLSFNGRPLLSQFDMLESKTIYHP